MVDVTRSLKFAQEVRNRGKNKCFCEGERERDRQINCVRKRKGGERAIKSMCVRERKSVWVCGIKIDNLCERKIK